ncbi:cytidylyltransferase domain-containing protein [Undibacterium crateris]|uniref:cytidylyltransferase domain-containing protein n=1 Tax=Undibacterium crateris TaxID=2528175 RepID=UPI00138960A8|nr:glycosyltransferase family protein [Undibacterium crateris]NDI84638.1 NTP transferase domain-containing protein [Undibacterium crateris]
MILAILQARCSSSRLPNKVLKPILGVPMIARQLERVQRAHLIDHLVVATSDSSSDDPLAALCEDLQISCFRGSLNDVLDRYYQAAASINPDHIVRLTGDCPLADPSVIDMVIEAHLLSGADYTANCVQSSFPDGLDVEICKFSVLQQAWEEAKLVSQREHVTLFINQQSDRFKVHHVHAREDLSHLRWTVDNPEDFELVSRIYFNLYRQNPHFTTEDVLALISKEPELFNINQHLERNEGLQKSLQNDQSI